MRADLLVLLGYMALALEHRIAALDEVVGGPRQPALTTRRPLKGREIREEAVATLLRLRGQGTDIHYRSWFELMAREGHAIVGQDPLAAFLTQISRSPVVERVGGKPGTYRIDLDEAGRRAAAGLEAAEGRSRALLRDHVESNDSAAAEAERAVEAARREVAEVARWQSRVAATENPSRAVLSSR